MIDPHDTIERMVVLCRRRCIGAQRQRRADGIVSKRKDSPYRSGRSPDWLKMKNPEAPAVKREAEEDWGR